MKQRNLERRLLGKWRSDRQRSLRHYKAGPQSTSTAQRKFRGLFGKMTVRWTPQRCAFELMGTEWSSKYEIIASDDQSVIVRMSDANGTDTVAQITFEGNEFYWVGCQGLLCEWFKRVK